MQVKWRYLLGLLLRHHRLLTADEHLLVVLRHVEDLLRDWLGLLHRDEGLTLTLALRLQQLVKVASILFESRVLRGHIHHQRLGLLDVRQLLRIAKRLRHTVRILGVALALGGVFRAGAFALVELERLNKLLVGLRLLALKDRAIGALHEVVRLHAVQLLLRALELELAVGAHDQALRVGARRNHLRLLHLQGLLRVGLLGLLLELLGRNGLALAHVLHERLLVLRSRVSFHLLPRR